jgi:hypothetical protein
MNLDEIPILNEEFYFMISQAFNSKTHRELVIVPREFHLDETHFISLFLNTPPRHQKCQRGNLFNANETHMKLPLRRPVSMGFHQTFMSINYDDGAPY